MKAIKNIRLPDYDYSNDGYYFVTIRTNYGRSYLLDHHDLVTNAIQNLNQLKGVKVDYYVVMRDHVHVIVILDGCLFKLGEIIRRLKATASKNSGLKMWQPNYYEHVIRTENALRNIRQYIINNPLVEKLEFEQFYTP